MKKPLLSDGWPSPLDLSENNSFFSFFSFFVFFQFFKFPEKLFGAVRSTADAFGAVRSSAEAVPSRSESVQRGPPPSPDLSKNFSFSGNAVKYQIWMMHLYVHFFSLPPCFETCSFSLLYLHSLSRSLEDGGTEKTEKTEKN